TTDTNVTPARIATSVMAGIKMQDGINLTTESFGFHGKSPSIVRDDKHRNFDRIGTAVIFGTDGTQPLQPLQSLQPGADQRLDTTATIHKSVRIDTDDTGPPIRRTVTTGIDGMNRPDHFTGNPGKIERTDTIGFGPEIPYRQHKPLRRNFRYIVQFRFHCYGPFNRSSR